MMDYKDQLAKLRSLRPTVVEQVGKRRLDHAKLHKEILAALGDQAKTVPDLATVLGKPTELIFWHLMALKKYNRIVEDKKQGDYVGYRQKN